MTRILFDEGLFSVIDDASAIGVGWQLSFYTANTTTRIITYTTPAGIVQNTNPVLSDAEGRFPEMWVDVGQTIKWALADEDGAIITTVDDFDIPATPPSFDPALDDFLAGDEPLPIASGGTGSESAVNALAALGAMGTAGGTFTGQIKQTSAGAYLYNSASGQVQGGVFVTVDSDPDPTSLAGQWWAKYT